MVFVFFFEAAGAAVELKPIKFAAQWKLAWVASFTFELHLKAGSKAGRQAKRPRPRLGQRFGHVACIYFNLTWPTAKLCNFTSCSLPCPSLTALMIVHCCLVDQNFSFSAFARDFNSFAAYFAAFVVVASTPTTRSRLFNPCALFICHAPFMLHIKTWHAAWLPCVMALLVRDRKAD